MLLRAAYVDQDGFTRDLTVRRYDHDIGIWSEHIDERGKVRVSHLHSLKVSCQFGAAELELLDDVGDLLEAVHVPVLVPLRVRYH